MGNSPFPPDVPVHVVVQAGWGYSIAAPSARGAMRPCHPGGHREVRRPRRGRSAGAEVLVSVPHEQAGQRIAIKQPVRRIMSTYSMAATSYVYALGSGQMLHVTDLPEGPDTIAPGRVEHLDGFRDTYCL